MLIAISKMMDDKIMDITGLDIAFVRVKTISWKFYTRNTTINTSHAVGVSRRQLPPKVDNILEFGVHIWNHHEKCTQKSTNMRGVVLVY